MVVVGIIEMVAVGVIMTESQKDFADVAFKLRPHDTRTNGKSDDRRAVAAAAGIAERNERDPPLLPPSRQRARRR